MITMLLEDMLTTLGYELAGIAYSLDEAMKVAQGPGIDLAILDINLNGKASFPVARVLRSRGIPYLFATGYDPTAEGDDFRDVAILRKPFNLKGLSQALSDAFERRPRSHSENGTPGGNHRGV